MMKSMAVIAIVLAALPALAQQPAPPGRFDSYLLALSWSPTWCDGNPEAEQCRPRRFGFVVHGLWPQYQAGGWPERCAAPSKLPEPVVKDMLPVMPSRTLIEHEWKKHGTCDGRSAAEYFGNVRQVFGRLVIPQSLRQPSQPQTLTVPEIEQAFSALNPGLTGDRLAVTCRGRFLAEIRVCLNRDLEYADCGPKVRDTCKGHVVMAPVK
jgi:ribonuclease T2